jgi:hypothetical protein
LVFLPRSQFCWLRQLLPLAELLQLPQLLLKPGYGQE